MGNANVHRGMSFNVCRHWERYKHLLLNSGIGGYIKQKSVMKKNIFHDMISMFNFQYLKSVNSKDIPQQEFLP